MYDFVILYRAKSIVHKRTVFASLKSSPKLACVADIKRGASLFALAMNATPNLTTCVQILVVA